VTRAEDSKAATQLILYSDLISKDVSSERNGTSGVAPHHLAVGGEEYLPAVGGGGHRLRQW
jgi:hypothetical protein